MLRVAFVGTFPASLAEPVRRHLTIRVAPGETPLNLVIG
jgi:hypothetical protein